MMPTSASANRQDLDRDGALLFAGALEERDLASLDRIFPVLPADRPGARLGSGLPLPLDRPDAIARSLLGPSARPVRAVLFDKSADRNWALGWHQDRVIAVRKRVEAPGFGDWTVKAGMVHVVPPFEILERMLTLRLHLDPAGRDNAPLRILPGSHRLGRIAESEIGGIVARHQAVTCVADRGDVWTYAATILHASDRAAAASRRRVLQLSYSADFLPGGLEWLGV